MDWQWQFLSMQVPSEFLTELQGAADGGLSVKQKSVGLILQRVIIVRVALASEAYDTLSHMHIHTHTW